MNRILAIIIIIIWVASCNIGCSTHKSKTVSSTKIDSITTTKIDSSTAKKKAVTQVKKSNTVIKKQANNTYEKETITVYDTVIAPGPQRIKYIIVKEKGVDKSKKTIIESHSDKISQITDNQVQVKKESSTVLHKEIKVKAKEVKTTSYWWLLWFLLIIPIWWLWKRYGGVIKAVWARFSI